MQNEEGIESSGEAQTASPRVVELRYRSAEIGIGESAGLTNSIARRGIISSYKIVPLRLFARGARVHYARLNGRRCGKVTAMHVDPF